VTFREQIQSAGPIEKAMDLFRRRIGQLRELLVPV
jgi:hypothetical protein